MYVFFLNRKLDEKMLKKSVMNLGKIALIYLIYLFFYFLQNLRGIFLKFVHLLTKNRKRPQMDDKNCRMEKSFHTYSLVYGV